MTRNQLEIHWSEGHADSAIVLGVGLHMRGLWSCLQGEYISPEKIENVYMRSPLVAQVFVYGESLQPNLVAVAVPDAETLLPWAASRGLPQDMKRLISDPSVVAAILNSMLEEGRTSKLQGFEQVHAGPLMISA